MKKILLIDGNSILFRAYYATKFGRPMTTSSGIPTNAVFGFINMLNKAIERIAPDGLLVAWDAGKKNFRHEKMESYKGTRKPLDDDLLVQMPIVREYLDAFGYLRYEQEGYEADDIIGSVSAQNQQEEIEMIVLTGDRDLLQLVNQNTKVLMMKKGIDQMDFMDEKAIWDQLELTPKQIIDLKGLMGDASDNIPGVAHIGEKTALTLLHKYGSVEGVYEHLDEITGKRKEYLQQGQEMAYLSKELATIFTQMDLPFSLENMVLPTQEKEEGSSFYAKYEMNSLLAKSQSARPKQEEIAIEEVKSFALLEKDQPVFLFPLTNQASFMEWTVFGYLYTQGEKAYFLSAENAKEDEAFKAFLLSNTPVYTWDAKELYHALDFVGMPHPKVDFDLHIAAFLLHSQATSTVALLEALEVQLPETLSNLAKKSLGGFTQERALPVFASWMLQAMEKVESIQEQLIQEQLDQLYYEIEFPLGFILYNMECEGISVSQETLKAIGVEYGAIMEKLSSEIYEMAGHSFNIGSPKQLGIVLFDELALPGGGKKRSTAAEVLDKLKDAHPIVEKVQEYRKYSKIVSTYIEGLSKYILNGRIHTTFNQTMTQTGRLSSSDPNLQNIAIKSDEGKMIRKAFIADEGCWLISADYSQIELRMLAHMANEQMMIDAFQQGIDIHNRTASIIFGVPETEVTEDQRRTAKTVNFAIIYGQTEFGLSQELHISRKEAKEFIQAYFANYPNIHRYMDGLVQTCEQNGYVETLMKRRRYIPEIKDKNFMTREFGKRAAMNAPVQGSAADLIKLAMVHMAKAIQEKGLKSKLVLQIHDELIFNVPEDEKEVMEQLIPQVMDHAMELHVPLESSLDEGRSWYEAK